MQGHIENVIFERAVLSAASEQLETQLFTQLVMMRPTFASLFEVQYRKRIFRLKEPIHLLRYSEDGYIYLESKPLSIISYGVSEQDAVASFCEDFSTLWDVIAQSSDGSLTPEARKVKVEMKNLVSTVVSE